MMTQGSRAGERHGYSRLFLALLGLAVLAAIAGLGWSYHLSGRLTHAETQLLQAKQQNEQLASALNETNARLKMNERLGHSLDARQRQLQQRARDLLKRQQEAAKQEAAKRQASSGNASGANSAAGAVNSNNGAQAALNAGEAQLQSTTGDLGADSGLIATNQQELDILKQKGDRNYYPFTLRKGKKQTVSTVTLQLTKADVKHSRYTLMVYADGRKIEKKDRGVNEPLQFYAGKDNFLYELVVNSIQKDEVTGYLATPLNAPVTAGASGN